MAAPFKRPRFNDDSAAGAIMAPPPVPPRRAAAESAPSHHAKRAPSVTSDSSAGSSSTIFGKTSDSSSAGKDNDGRARAVVDSASQVVKRALMAMPKVTQPVKKPLRFRRKVSKDEDVDWVFKNVFMKTEYKGKQEEIMKVALQGSDVLVIAPTGMGKSLCFQVPAVAEKHGLTVVVSPLLSLMHDQVNALHKLDVPCAMLSSKDDREDQAAILKDMESGHPKNRLLYITPERLSSANFRRKLRILHKQQEFNRLVVDEAHCISEWGHDFRPEYSKLGAFRADFPKVPIMALTASATPSVQNDIVNELALDPDLLYKVIHPFNRPNLYYEIRYFSEAEDGPLHRSEEIFRFISKTTNRSTKGDPTKAFSGIVYCRAKKTCDELAAYLRGKGVNAAPYHRGLKDHEADGNQARWVNNDRLAVEGKPRVDCIVATIAFGMGIDKSNCRYVVHYDVPKSFEGYYQETGRAGRDGHISRCLLFYSAEDKIRIKELVCKTFTDRERRAERGFAAIPSQRAPNSIDALLAYCENVKVCRHVLICRYFGEKIALEDADAYCNRLCDVCRDPDKVRKRRTEGLIELDFAATQRVIEVDVNDSEIDPDDFFGTPREVEPVPSDAEDDSGEETRAKVRDRREGFRTAAVQLGRDEARAANREADEYDGPDPPVSAFEEDEAVPDGDEAAPLADSDDSDDEESVVGRVDVDLTLLRDSDVDEDEQAAPSPGQPLVDEAADRARLNGDEGVEEEEKQLPALAELVSNTRGRSPVAVDSEVQPVRPALGPKSIVSIINNIPPSKTGKFVTPFADPTRHPKYQPAKKLKLSGEASSSVGTDPPDEFDVVPQIYDKKIPVPLRRQAVRQLAKHLQRATLSKHGIRSSVSEEEIWSDLGGDRFKHEERRSAVLRACIEIESDLFWTCVTTEGYRQFFKYRTAGLKELISTDERLPAANRSGLLELDWARDAVEALKRAVKQVAREVKRGKRRQASPESEDED